MKKITLLLLSAFAFSTAKAQYSHAVNIVISEHAAIRLKPTTLEFMDFEFDTPTKLNDGITRWGAGTYQVRSNNNWLVSAKAADTYFTNSGADSSPNMPCSILKLKEGNSQAGFFTLTESDQALVSGQPGDFGGQNEFNLDYKATPGMGYGPGTYVMNVYLTVTNN